MARLLDSARKQRTDEVESFAAYGLGRQMCSPAKPSAGVTLLFVTLLTYQSSVRWTIIRRFADTIE